MRRPRPGEPVQGRYAGVGDRHREPPEHEARIAVGDGPGHPERARNQFPDEVVDEVLPERPPAQGDDQERRAPELNEQIAGDEQPRAPVERVSDRDRHQQAREHQPDEQQAHRQPVRVQPVRPHAIMDQA
jgi:hypothetical protein